MYESIKRLSTILLVVTMLVSCFIPAAVFANINDVSDDIVLEYIEFQETVDELISSENPEDHIEAILMLEENGIEINKTSFTLLDLMEDRRLDVETDPKASEIYSEEELELLLNYEKVLEEQILDLQNKPVEYFELYDYTEEQVEAILNYDGSEEMLLQASPWVEIYGAFFNFYHDSVESQTHCQMIYAFQWHGNSLELWTEKDIFAATWSHPWNRSAAQGYISYPIENFNTTIHKSVDVEIYDFYTVSIVFDSSEIYYDEENNVRLNSISRGSVISKMFASELLEQTNISAYISYGRNFLQFTPSISISGKGLPGASIGYEFGTDEVAKFRMTYRPDSTEPISSAPVLYEIEPGYALIHGTGKPGARIIILLPDNTMLSTTVSEETHYWSVYSNSYLYGNQTVFALQLELDPSDPTKTLPASPQVSKQVQLKSDPPSITPVGHWDTHIIGYGVPGATVQVTFENGTVFSDITVRNDSIWILALPHRNVNHWGAPGTYLYATQTEPGKLESDLASVVIENFNAENSFEPQISIPILTTDTAIKGTGTPSAAIDVTLPNGDTIYTFGQPDGTWTANLEHGQLSDFGGFAGTFVYAIQIEDGKANSDAVSAIISDPVGIKSAKPAVNFVAPSSPSITGTGVPGSTISLTVYSSGKEYTQTVGSNGVWTIIHGESLVFDDLLHVYQTEPGKVISDIVVAFVGR